MKTLTLVLILAAFLQSTIIPLELVLLILVLRSYIRLEKENLYLGFFIGLLVSFLSNTPLGIHSLIYLILIQLTHLLSKSALSKNILFLIPQVIISLLLSHLVLDLLSRSSISLMPQMAVEVVLAVPIYIILRIWEEHFIIRPEIKLRV